MTDNIRSFLARSKPVLAAIPLLLALFTAASPADAAESGLVAALARSAPAANPHVLALAARALRCVRHRMNVETLGVIDYSLPSTRRRLWVFDLHDRQLLLHEWVAHGRNSGGNRATHFSNRPGSLMSSLGTFVADGTYIGHNGLSLRLKGLSGRFNNEAEKRAIVIHGADYVSRSFARHEGRMGRSYGCPAVRRKVAHRFIDSMRGHGMLFAYYPDHAWLAGSHLLNGCDSDRAGHSGAVTAAP